MPLLYQHKKAHLYAYWMVALSVFFFVAHRFWVERVGFIESLASVIAYPCLVFKARIANPLIKRYGAKPDYELVREELSFLRQKNQDLLARVITLEAERDFMEKTHELASYARRYKMNTARCAHVVAQQCNAQHAYMLVDLGSKHGIEEGMVAIVKNCIVGKVMQVFPYWSRVVLMTDGACKVAVTCARSKVSGIYEGNNCGGGVLRFVSHLAPIAHNDLLITSGEGLIFPEGFGIGYIDSFEKNDLICEVRVRPLIEPHELSYCYLAHKGELH